ncbi:MAG: PAS domain S-box protein [Gemmatimonadaceae bacterium]
MDDLKRADAALRESESRFRDIAENIREVFWLASADQKVMYLSPAYEDIWGQSVESCYANDLAFFDAVHPDDKESFAAALKNKNEGFGVEYRIVRPDGEIRWIHDRAFPIRDGRGNVVRVAGIAEDITARRALESNLHMQSKLLASVNLAIALTDIEGRIVTWNNHAEIVYGWTAEEAIGRNFFEIILLGEASASEVSEIRAALGSGEHVVRELEVTRRDGSRVWTAIRLSPIMDAQGRVTHIAGSSVDITERRRLEQQFRQAQKMEAVGRLAGGIAHDFNNVLTVIKGHAEFLSLDLPASGESREDVDQITKSAARAASLTRQLLAFSRQQVLEMQVIEANALLRDMERMLGSLIGGDILLTLTLDDSALVFADESQLEQVIMNLVINARDAMPGGGSLRVATRKVRLDSEEASRHPEARAGRYVAIDVTDTGTGIEPDLLVKIFEPFFTTKELGKGTGLGLATVYGIAQQSGGFVDVQSSPGRGSTFTLYVPAAQVDAAAIPLPACAGTVPGNELILLVEDQDEVRKVGKRILVSRGYRVVEARNGVEALAVLQAPDAGVDLVVTDAVMPLMNGTDLVRSLRGLDPSMPVIIASGYTDPELVAYCTGELGVLFLAKPFRTDDLIRLVRETLDAAGRLR